MTTTIALETSRGNLTLAMSLGIILIFIALILNSLALIINSLSSKYSYD
jgi:tungstate transport system permease protein